MLIESGHQVGMSNILLALTQRWLQKLNSDVMEIFSHCMLAGVIWGPRVTEN